MSIIATAPVPAHSRIDRADTLTLPVFDAATATALLVDPVLTAQEKMARLSPSVPFEGESAERAVEHLTRAAGIDPEDVAIAHQLSAFLQDPGSNPDSKAEIRSGIQRMIKIAEDVAFLARTHDQIKAAVVADQNLTDEQRREALAHLAPYDGQDGSVAFRVLTEEEDIEGLWKAFASGARLALGGADDTAEAWRSAPVKPLEGEALIEYLTKLRAESDADREVGEW
ncbi:hypothetical protein RB614_32260 [Phytohabitans sp. ZYX-F-186]|uniref:DUF222 domain-containing protein n=1 Tax=Phytohabitans maris TaxID=3071409 RepID=A0ABU0ZQA2_9ACTN|nr:hypothetical protein [Phytohabitans sp. ZYX-F-186]MDQ7909206.1 hypothetical protein [Phytohabitans sp. ZYX-F-186]